LSNVTQKVIDDNNLRTEGVILIRTAPTEATEVQMQISFIKETDTNFDYHQKPHRKGGSVCGF
jgi:hypothetical protein